MEKKEINVINEDDVVSLEILAESIVKISDAMDKLLSTPVTLDTIVLLIKNTPGMSQVSKVDIRNTLLNIQKMKEKYLK